MRNLYYNIWKNIVLSVHERKKPFKCEICGAKFAQNITMSKTKQSSTRLFDLKPLDFINILTKDPAERQDLLQTVEYTRKTRLKGL